MTGRLIAAIVVLLAASGGDLGGQETGLRRSRFPPRLVAREVTSPVAASEDSPRPSIVTNELRDFEGRIVCTQAEGPSARDLAASLEPVERHQINHLDRKAAQAQAGLQILLRATAQLENYPSAKAAFLRAAALWESLIYSNLQIYVDVDFGPLRFGQPYPDRHILGSANSVLYTASYSPVRAQFVQIFPSDPETQALPDPAVPTDIGDVGEMSISDAVLRVIGLRPETAGADDPAPTIGFNSAFSFDFDPSDGLQFTEIEFLDVAVHELGHVLGFTSMAGATELDPLRSASLSFLDLHRFRPNAQSFRTDLRILSSGGDQSYYTDGFEAPLSTGRPDGTGGDEHQASHWKDNELLGYYVGIMDPTLRRGSHPPLTPWDLVALNRMGYGISVDFNQAWIYRLTPLQVFPGSGPTTLMIEGEQFQQGAQVLWKGQPRATTVLSESTVSVALSAEDLSVESVASVEVLNPGSIPSNARFFEVTRNCFRCTRVVRR